MNKKRCMKITMILLIQLISVHWNWASTFGISELVATQCGNVYSNENLAIDLYHWLNESNHQTQLISNTYRCVIIRGLNKKEIDGQEITAVDRYVYEITFKKVPNMENTIVPDGCLIAISSSRLIANSDSNLRLYFKAINVGKSGASYLIWNRGNFLEMKFRRNRRESSNKSTYIEAKEELSFILTSLHFHTNDYGNVTFRELF